MILSIGIDAVEIERFSHWHTYSQKTLQRIFSPEEIAYCLSCPKKSAERFAARFATREALFKAWHSAYPQQKLPFLTLCKAIAIQKTAQGAPILVTNLVPLSESLTILLSWTHTQNTATAVVLIQKA